MNHIGKHLLKKGELLLLAVLLCALLCGCHGSKGQAAFVMPEEFDSTKPIEISFWAKNDTNKSQVDVYKKAISDFEAAYPNVKVNLKLYTDYLRIYNDVITNISTGTTPDVCITYPDHIATYMTGTNVVVPLDGLMNDAKYGLGGSAVNYDSTAIGEIVPEFLEECRLFERFYALPFMRSTEACYINKTYLEKLGYRVPDELTWDFVWKVSEEAMAKGDDGNYLVNGQKTMIPFVYKSTDNMMIQMLRQLDAPYCDANGNVLLFNDTTRELLKTVAQHAATGAFSTFKISSYPANFLNAGQCLFAIDSTAGATWMGCDAPLLDIDPSQIVEFETVVRKIPQFDPDHPQMISQGPSVCLFNKEDPQQVLASWLFMQYLLTNEVQLGYAKTEGYVPVTLKAQQSEEYKDYLSRSGEDNNEHYSIKIDSSVLMMENVADTFTTPVYNGSANLRDAAGYLIEDVTKSEQRHEKVDDGTINVLFGKVISLKHLGEGGAQRGANGEKADLGPLPSTAVVLLLSLAAVWLCIGAYFVIKRFKK